MKYDVIVGNPPFQNKEKRNTTPHKIWIDFTHKAFESLNEGGALVWISPASWGSPSNKVLNYFRRYKVEQVNFDTGEYFPGIGSTFSDYLIYKTLDDTSSSQVTKRASTFDAVFNQEIKYLANDFCELSFGIHKKVMFDTDKKLDLKYDYVTCHNVIRHAHKIHNKKIAALEARILKEPITTAAMVKIKERLQKLIEKEIEITISEVKTKTHVHPILHTNNKVWYSSIKQDFADKKKVMWSRSGYTKPFYDDGAHGCTDLCYYILVKNKKEGTNLVKNLNSELFRYIFTTARWSGFGNDKVFKMLPDLQSCSALTEKEMYDLFNINTQEREYIKSFFSAKSAPKKRSKRQDSQTNTRDRVDNFGEVYTPSDLVKQTLKNLKVEAWQKGSTFIDPACGNGNFLVEVVLMKIENGSTPEEAVSTTYGIDIIEDNVIECRKRLNEITKWQYTDVIKQQIKIGDFLESYE